MNELAQWIVANLTLMPSSWSTPSHLQVRQPVITFDPRHRVLVLYPPHATLGQMRFETPVIDPAPYAALALGGPTALRDFDARAFARPDLHADWLAFCSSGDWWSMALPGVKWEDASRDHVLTRLADRRQILFLDKHNPQVAYLMDDVTWQALPGMQHEYAQRALRHAAGQAAKALGGFPMEREPDGDCWGRDDAESRIRHAAMYSRRLW